MACKNPLLGYPSGWTEKGKIKYKILKKQSSFYDVPKDLRPIEIPCGKCIGCRLEYSRQWANRCMLELESHESSYFVTLTYDDKNLPENRSVSKREMQLFMKRLRFQFKDQKIRFYGCGEYGDKTMRPHYHIILFGLKLDDLVLYKKSGLGYNYYNSPSLDAVWQKGYCVVADVSWDTCAYTARYVLKKLNGDMAKVYSELNIEPEFVLMSRRPGIGREYYDKNKGELYNYDYINVKTDKGGKKFKPPRYYDTLYEIENPEKMQEIKEKRLQSALHTETAKLLATSLNELELSAVTESNLQSKIKILKRRNQL